MGVTRLRFMITGDGGSRKPKDHGCELFACVVFVRACVCRIDVLSARLDGGRVPFGCTTALCVGPDGGGGRRGERKRGDYKVPKKPKSPGTEFHDYVARIFGEGGKKSVLRPQRVKSQKGARPSPRAIRDSPFPFPPLPWPRGPVDRSLAECQSISRIASGLCAISLTRRCSVTAPCVRACVPCL